jgi:hypothetical protein
MKKIRVIEFYVILTLCFIFAGCKSEIEYRYVIKEIATRPTFEQIFTFFSVDDETKNRIRSIYNAMTIEDIVDLKYNYYSAIPVFWTKNNVYNPQDTIEYKGNAIYIRGRVEDINNFNSLFKAALEGYKNDNLNQLSLFQNSVSFGKGSGKTVQKASFSSKSKVDFPKTEVLENPQLTKKIK